jgi:hypothetical protein
VTATAPQNYPKREDVAAVAGHVERRGRCTRGEPRKSLRRGPWSPVIPRPGRLRGTPSQVFRAVTHSSAACKWTGKMLAAQGHIASPRLKLSRGEKYTCWRAASTLTW